MVTADKIWWTADEMRLLARRGPRATRYPTADRSIHETVVVVATAMPQMGAVMMTPRALPTAQDPAGDGDRHCEGRHSEEKPKRIGGDRSTRTLHLSQLASRRLHPLATF